MTSCFFFVYPHVFQEMFGSKRSFERMVRNQFRKRGGVKAKATAAKQCKTLPLTSKLMPVPPKPKPIPQKAMPVSQTRAG